MNSCCQVDLIDMQSNPDNNYKFIFVYQDHLTKFVILRPLKFKRAEEVAYCLLDIFTLFGAPNILHSDNGREFVNAVITNLCSMWPEVKIVHGKARHSQSQGSVERANQDIESMIATWMETNKTTKWSESLRFEFIKRSPYEAMFGIKMKMGLANSIIPKNVLPGLQTEEDLEAALTEPIFENEEVEINKDDETLANENLEIRDVENVILVRTQKINQHREESHIGLQKQARKMKEMSNKQMPTVLIGQTVKVKIPEVDRSKVDARTLLAVVLKVVDGEFYRLGTKAGTLSQLFTRNQFTLCEENCLKSAIIPENEIGIRQAVSQLSLTGGQGLISMSSKINGTQQKLSDIVGHKIPFIPCQAHRLNISVEQVNLSKTRWTARAQLKLLGYQRTNF
ncbi:uncharacterized protein LOC103311995 [Acyrthosiphon pisum]|uniref:Integrase catalytic domain-containing protein n=1 Tax=Acyrthosiphon pisum TaxID=7029 RepID=A0A8R2FE18_ACYPI|nr:uncharacterized protein LOC103311995 [Acyrthosiphon pisum]|eukprot:XP_008190170.1 PREDICTED: uncharacterized protein LOC103311995 [Acyrthosiphon pisum]